jgi:hypothetical protein
MNKTPSTTPSFKSNAATIERVLHLTGWLIIAVAAIVGIAFSNNPSSKRFSLDTTDGATANAIESLQTTVQVSMFLFGGVALVIYSKLCQIARRLKRGQQSPKS